eukprot:scaffold55684_cov43-Attheya_sp.AAC.1
MLAINPNDDSLDSALCNWNIMGHYYGYRKSEWVQDRTNLRKNALQRLPNGDVQAFRRDDYIFLGPDGGTRIPQGDGVILDEDDPAIGQVACRWQYQKNGNNGQIKTQSRNKDNPALCPVRASIRIRHRSQICGGSAKDPMALFINNRTNKSQFISDKHVEDHLQRVAKDVYKITDKKELARWMCHSLRVGACVSLFNQQEKGEAFIQFQLRWRSGSWKDYIRDSPQLSAQHINATNVGWNKMLMDTFVCKFYLGKNSQARGAIPFCNSSANAPMNLVFRAKCTVRLTRPVCSCFDSTQIII